MSWASAGTRKVSGAHVGCKQQRTVSHRSRNDALRPATSSSSPGRLVDGRVGGSIAEQALARFESVNVQAGRGRANASEHEHSPTVETAQGEREKARAHKPQNQLAGVSAGCECRKRAQTTKSRRGEGTTEASELGRRRFRRGGELSACAVGLVCVAEIRAIDLQLHATTAAARGPAAAPRLLRRPRPTSSSSSSAASSNYPRRRRFRQRPLLMD